MTCSGLSPFYDTLYNMEYLLKDFHFYLFYLEDSGDDCLIVDNESSYLPITNHLQTLESLFPSLYATLSCENHSGEWVQLIQSDICGNMFNGLFVIWILQIVLNGYLLCIVIYCSYLYPYLKQFGLLSSTHGQNKDIDDESYGERNPAEQMVVTEVGKEKVFNPIPSQIAKESNVEMI